MSILDRFITNSAEEEPEYYEVPGLDGVRLDKETAKAIQQWARTRASKDAERSLLSPTTWLAGEGRKERAANMSMEDALEYWKIKNRQFDSNTLAKAERGAQALTEEDDPLDAWQRKFWRDDIEGSIKRRDVGGFAENVANTIADPVNLIGAGARAGYKAVTGVNALIGGATDAVEQGAEMAQGARDEYDLGRTGMAAAASGALGAAAKGVIDATPKVVEGVKNTTSRFAKWLANRSAPVPQTEDIVSVGGRLVRTPRYSPEDLLGEAKDIEPNKGFLGDTYDKPVVTPEELFGEAPPMTRMRDFDDAMARTQRYATEEDIFGVPKKPSLDEEFESVFGSTKTPEKPVESVPTETLSGRALDEMTDKVALKLGAKVRTSPFDKGKTATSIVNPNLPKEGLQSSADTSAVISGSGATPNSKVLLEPVKLQSDIAKEADAQKANQALFGAPKKTPTLDEEAAAAKAALEKAGKSAKNPTKRSRSKKQ